MLKHIGYGVEDSMGDVFIYGSMLDPREIEESRNDAISLREQRDAEWPEFSPHNIVRVLIDDEVENG